MKSKYVIKNNGSTMGFTDIGRIGIIKEKGDDRSSFKKSFKLDSLPDFAAVRFDSVGVCAAYVNGEFIATNTGRYANRISYAECTSKMRVGDNEIELVVDSHFYQTFTRDMRKRRKPYFSSVAAELEMTCGSESIKISTDNSWLCESDDGQTTPQVFTNITLGEYNRFWLSAALWAEEKPISAPDAVIQVATGYKDYISKPKAVYAYPSAILDTNMEKDGDALLSTEERSHVLYEFDKLYCGYVCLECEADADGEVELRFDYTGYSEDVEFETPNYNISAKRLTIIKPLKKGENKLFIIQRRACVYLKAVFNVKVKLTKLCIKLDMINHSQLGYFKSSDECLNEMWEVGKYTLHINKHQEYESCPRNEMKYFSGDGIIAALIDAYAFGDGALTVSSLSFTEISSNLGRITDPFIRNIGLWEYPAWRIIQAYNHYRYFNDVYLVRQHFDELAININWMISKMSPSCLIYQYPIFSGAFARDFASVDYTQSYDRLGEKPHVNALFYKSLLVMAELAEVVGDDRAEEWFELAQKVKKAINERLWSDEEQAYVDTYNTSYIPQDGNALCLAFGIAEGDRAEAAMKTLREKLWTPYGATVLSSPSDHQYCNGDTVSPLMNTFEAEARFKRGDKKGALELMDRCWGGMLRRGTKSFWEYANADGKPKVKHFTLCHAWSAGCTYLLGAHVLGIRPAEVGYKTLEFEPCEEIDSFEGVVPTVKGLVAVRCETENGKKKYTLALPEGISLISRIPENATLETIKY